jgi:conjugative relaxase-like TrwC/TraI family protein
VSAVSHEDFRAVLHGLNPATGEVLVPSAKGNGERRAGWDATFNAPKSVSIQALVGNDARLAQAHRAAVGRALIELEGYALSRQQRGHEWAITGTSSRPASTTSPRGLRRVVMTAPARTRISTRMS